VCKDTGSLDQQRKRGTPQTAPKKSKAAQNAENTKMSTPNGVVPRWRRIEFLLPAMTLTLSLIVLSWNNTMNFKT
jgi:hypothetical protein